MFSGKHILLVGSNFTPCPFYCITLHKKLQISRDFWVCLIFLYFIRLGLFLHICVLPFYLKLMFNFLPQVYRATNKKRELAAVKVVDNHPSKLDELQNEITMIKRFTQHRNMVKYFGTYLFRDAKDQPTHIWVVMEVCSCFSVLSCYLNPTGKSEKKQCGGVYFWLQNIAFWMLIEQQLTPPLLLFSVFCRLEKMMFCTCSKSSNTLKSLSGGVSLRWIDVQYKILYCQ